MKKRAVKKGLSSLMLGEQAEIVHQVSGSDVDAFAQISGDYNPLHMDEEFARSFQFKGRVVHGMFLGALVSQLVGMQLPGAHALLVKETLGFRKPVFIDDTVRLVGTVTAKSDVTRLIEIGITVDRAGEIVASGSVIIRVLQ